MAISSSRLSLVFLVVLTFLALHANGEISPGIYREIHQINIDGPYLGLVVPNSKELNALIENPHYKHAIDIYYAGKTFNVGTLAEEKVIVVMSGSSMINAAITTQLLLNLFNIKGVVNVGVAGDLFPYTITGSVEIPKEWAHTSLWHWQRFKNEENGDYIKKYGHLNFANYSSNLTGCNGEVDNLLSNVWYQPEEVYPVDGTPEEKFWIPVDPYYLEIANSLLGLPLEPWSNHTIGHPDVSIPHRGVSSSFFVDNDAYRQFLFSHFKASVVDMESAAVSLVCYQQRKPFIAIHGISNIAGQGKITKEDLATNNSIITLVAFVKKLHNPQTLPVVLAEA